MIRRKLQILNQLGLHARACAKFVQAATKFQSHILISREDHCVNGKSILGVMMLAASQFSWVELEITGGDEEAALVYLETLIQQRFGEAQ